MRRLVYLCLLALAALSTTGTYAVPERSGPGFIIANWFPTGWEQDGEPRGFLVEIVQAIDEALGMESELSLVSMPRVIRTINNDSFDYTFAYKYDRTELYELEAFDPKYLLDVGCVRTTIVSLADRPVKALDDLNGMRVAFTNSAYFFYKFAPEYDIESVLVSETDTLFQMLLRGRVDAFVVNDIVFTSFLNNLHPSYKVPHQRWKDIAEPLFIDKIPFSVLASTKTATSPLSDKIRGLHGNEEFRTRLQKIYQKYGLQGGANCTLPAES